MKLFISSALILLFALGFSQENQEDQPKLKGHQISLNVFDLAATETVEISYEKYLKSNQSIEVQAALFEHFGYHTISAIEKNNSHSIGLAYRFYLGEKDHAGFYLAPFAKYVFGKQKYKDFIWMNDNGEQIVETFERKFNDLYLGLTAGYKWNIGKHFSIDVNSSFIKNIKGGRSSTDLQGGINLGFRF